MMNLNPLYSGRKARPGPRAAPFFAHLPLYGNGSQESKPWAKEANPLFPRYPTRQNMASLSSVSPAAVRHRFVVSLPDSWNWAAVPDPAMPWYAGTGL
jgi:hypothetical protein